MFSLSIHHWLKDIHCTSIDDVKDPPPPFFFDWKIKNKRIILDSDNKAIFEDKINIFWNDSTVESTLCQSKLNSPEIQVRHVDAQSKKPKE